MGMFDEADEITLPFGSLHQFQTILDVMENQELVLKDEPNRLSFVKKLSKMADFLGIRVADFTALKTKWLNCTLIRRSSRDGSAGGHRKHRLHYHACGRDHDC
jgi:hypothetical protein